MSKRDEAIMRGLEFIYATARDPSSFEDYGFDYTFCLHWIASTSRNATLRRAARTMAVECARRWREVNPTLPEDADAETVAQAVFGGLTSDRLGLRDASFRREVRDAASRVDVCDVLWFDLVAGPPPEESLGLTDRHALTRRGIDFLLSTQNADGSWGDAEAEDAYDRYHPTLTAVNGLRDYSWKEKRLVFPRLLPELKRWSRAGRQ